VKELRGFYQYTTTNALKQKHAAQIITHFGSLFTSQCSTVFKDFGLFTICSILFSRLTTIYNPAANCAKTSSPHAFIFSRNSELHGQPLWTAQLCCHCQISVFLPHKPHTCLCFRLLFSQLGNMKTQANNHTREKPFVSSYCPKQFTQNTYVKQYVRVHAEERPFTCQYSIKSFTQAFYLKHQLVHTGKEPFTCQRCDKQFTQGTCLKTHLRNHTKKKNIHPKWLPKKSCMHPQWRETLCLPPLKQRIHPHRLPVNPCQK